MEMTSGYTTGRYIRYIFAKNNFINFYFTQENKWYILDVAR